MSIFMDDVDALHEEYRRSGPIVRWTHEYALGTEEVNVEPDGRRLRMGSDATGPADTEALKHFSEME